MSIGCDLVHRKAEADPRFVRYALACRVLSQVRLLSEITWIGSAGFRNCDRKRQAKSVSDVNKFLHVTIARETVNSLRILCVLGGSAVEKVPQT